MEQTGTILENNPNDVNILISVGGDGKVNTNLGNQLKVLVYSREERKVILLYRILAERLAEIIKKGTEWSIRVHIIVAQQVLATRKIL
jgi:thiamine biosynthesis protein ThiC